MEHKEKRETICLSTVMEKIEKENKGKYGKFQHEKVIGQFKKAE
ncbi:hypothetical protein [Sutcliffiella horikoshii]|nr:hypothetical protein [Sutcliffiella horikoshii]